MPNDEDRSNKMRSEKKKNTTKKRAVEFSNMNVTVNFERRVFMLW